MNPRIYVACLASYNNGVLHGAWIDADQDADAINDEISTMLKASPEPGAEEWAIHDYEDFGSWQPSEYEDIATVSLMGLAVADDDLCPAYLAYVDHHGGIKYATEEQFRDDYCGEWGGEEEYAMQLFDDIFVVPDNIATYIDYEKFAHDLFMSDNYSIDNPDGGVWVFRNS